MATLPHSQIYTGVDHTVVITGPHLQIVEIQTGRILQSTAQPEAPEHQNILKAGPIRCSTVDVGFQHVITCAEDKLLKVWQIDGLKLLSARELPKKPTGIKITRDGQTILVSDKFGDIFSYPLQPAASSPPESATSASKRNAIISHENPSNGTLILGHTSLLTTFCLTEDEKYVISADRDEHVRVSWYPQGYIIERFCLGHQKYVSAIHVPSFAPSMLFSGGGDPVIKLWDWMSGELLADIPIEDTVLPFIIVRAPKGRYGRADEDGEDEQPKLEKRGRRRGKGKNVQKNVEETVEVTMADAENEAEAEPEHEVKEGAPEAEASAKLSDEKDAGEDVPPEAQEEPLVLALQRIDSVDVEGQGRFFLFSAVGATALFYGSFPPSPNAQSEWSIASVDLGKPVIDFAHDGHFIWVLVDGEYKGSISVGKQEDSRIVKLLKWVDGKLVEVVTTSSEAPPLLTSLNETCRLPATASDLKTLDIYSPLSSLPKNVDPEHDPLRKGALDVNSAEDDSSRQGTPQATGSSKTQKSREPTQRELARAKNKKAVLAKIQENEKAKEARKADSIELEGAREVKKARPDDDVQMSASS